MRTDDPKETVQIDGGELTTEEAKLFAEGVDEKDSDTPPAGDPAAEAAAAAEAARLAQEQADADALAQQQAAAAASREAAAPQGPGDKPADRDFDAEEKALDELLDKGDLSTAEYAKKMRELTNAETDHKLAVADWTRANEAHQAAVATRAAAGEAEWNTAAVAFEAANKEFLANPMRHQRMQEAITLVQQKARDEGKPQPNAKDLLDTAAAIAKDFCGWVDKAPVDPKAAMGAALAARQVEKPGKGLGDVPTAHVDSIRDNASYEALDGLPIGDLEATLANMKPTEVERYLRTAEGANATGRD